VKDVVPMVVPVPLTLAVPLTSSLNPASVVVLMAMLPVDWNIRNLSVLAVAKVKKLFVVISVSPVPAL
jgi:hypothetical protein